MASNENLNVKQLFSNYLEKEATIAKQSSKLEKMKKDNLAAKQKAAEDRDRERLEYYADLKTLRENVLDDCKQFQTRYGKDRYKKGTTIMLPNCKLVKTDGTQFLVFKGQDLISNHLKKELYENDIHQLCLKLLVDASEGVVLIFVVVFSFFLFIMFACVYIGWIEIRSMPISDIWQRIKK